MWNRAPLIALVAACATAAAAVALAGPPHRPPGTLVVGITYSGGPHRAHRSLHGGRVSIVRGREVIRSATVRRGHRAHLRLAPGKVRVEATSGDAHCPSMHVTVVSSETRRLTVVCGVR